MAMVAKAERPVMLVGNGCARTRVTKQLNRWVDETGIYAAMTFMAKGVISDRNEKCLYAAGLGIRDHVQRAFEHADLVTANARLHGIDMAWIFAVMRQESAFMSNARSHAGAMGLMQLMPRTARSTGREPMLRRWCRWSWPALRPASSPTRSRPAWRSSFGGTSAVDSSSQRSRARSASHCRYVFYPSLFSTGMFVGRQGDHSACSRQSFTDTRLRGLSESGRAWNADFQKMLEMPCYILLFA